MNKYARNKPVTFVVAIITGYLILYTYDLGQTILFILCATTFTLMLMLLILNEVK